MRLGGFVIHGNNRDTLADCLDSLVSVCDEVVAVDSLSTDGSAALVRERGARRIEEPWRGYGHARTVAADALRGCDYLFFLDSDERLARGAAQDFVRWRASGPTLPHYLLAREDLVSLPGRPSFVFRTEHHVRLVRRDAADWQSSMIVHEGLSRRRSGRMPAVIEHLWLTDLSKLLRKHKQYALLWALQAARAGRRPDVTLLRREAHVLRDCLWKGAIFRGGREAVRIAWATSLYHRRKHELLAQIRAGAYSEKLSALEAGKLEELYR